MSKFTVTRFFTASTATAGLVLTLLGCGGGPHAPASRVQLNDTGLLECKDNQWQTVDCIQQPQQDGAYGRDANHTLVKLGAGSAAFDFIKIDSDGHPLEAAAGVWPCVQDNYTNLLWEIKSSASDTPQYSAHTYSWYQPDSTLNAGNAGVPNGGNCNDSCDTHAYITWANQQQLCGSNQWRLPTVNELLSIANQSVTNPPLDKSYFPNSAYNAYWTSQTAAFEPENVWYVYFTAAGNGKINKSSQAHIRLVSGEPKW